MKGLYKLNLKTYWTDYIVSSILFCIAFYFTYTAGSIIGFILASVFLYRLCAFTHEIAHQNKNPQIKWFKRIWNLTGGLLMLQPSIRFTRPHLKHHTTGTFATKDDPQYPLIFANPLLAFAIFIILPFALPIYNLLVCLLSVRHNKIENILYKGIEFTTQEYNEAYAYEFYYIVLWAFVIALKPGLILTLYLVSVGAWLLSVLRIPLEHPLSEYKETSVARDQEVLSYTHESPVYIPVQPLALRYHTAHHMYPKVPYHNLRKFHYELRSSNVAVD